MSETTNDGEKMDMIKAAWGIIANAGGGNWERESTEWQEAAARWRDKYHALLASIPRPRGAEER